MSFLVTTAISASAHADIEDLTDAKAIVSLERVVSLVTWESVSVSPSGGSSATGTVTTFGTFASAPGGAGDAFALVPRLAVDGVVGHGFTLGAAAWIFVDVSSSTSSMGTSQDNPKRTYGGVAPRLGYIVPLTPSLAFWPRAGVAYSTVSKSSNNSASATGLGSGASLNQFSVDLEGNLVYSPFPHLGFDLELFGSIPASGNASVNNGNGTSSSVPIAEAVVGLTGGILGWF
jgi:hypothetical protein